MKATPIPRHNLPQSLRGCQDGTFAQYTVRIRLPDIARHTCKDNLFSAEIAAGFEALAAEFPDHLITPIRDPGAPDEAAWLEYVTPHLNDSWSEVSWFFAETYFYRRILALSGYFQPGSGLGRDPFAHQKRLALQEDPAGMSAACQQFSAWLDDPAPAPEVVEARLAHLFHLALGGNRADLSMWPKGRAMRADHPDGRAQEAGMLCDDSQAAAAFTSRLRRQRVDVVLDNTGMELLTDLFLAEYLLAAGLARRVDFHCKSHPTFISDATILDVLSLVGELTASPLPCQQQLGLRLKTRLADRDLVLRDHFYWTSPRFAWQMHDELYQDLRRSSLLISKGDANFRRFAGDLHWPPDSSPTTVFGYLNLPLLLLRVCKSDVTVGLPAMRAAELDRLDPHWRINGRWGTVIFHEA